MKVAGRWYRAVWWEDGQIGYIDQRKLPHRFEVATARSRAEAVAAIKDMAVRGAPTIGVMAAYGLAMATAAGEDLRAAHDALLGSRPTAVNLKHALAAVMAAAPEPARMLDAARAHDEREVAAAEAIGAHGAGLMARHDRVLTHCNAGWLAAQDWGTALSPIYRAIRDGARLSVYVDETRPRLQGTRITAWELKQEGVEHAIVADGAAASLLRAGKVGAVIVGADRVAANGDVANKIGTYSLALAARAAGVPFYVAAPLSTVDPGTPTGDAIPIEERGPDEVVYAEGLDDSGKTRRVRLAPEGSPAVNPAFDVTPADLVTAIITERGVQSPLRMR
jgi:S-methyl-5-thioribose-1-phosphate isomerase